MSDLLQQTYMECVETLVSDLLASDLGSIQAILLHGGLARGCEPIEEWSDIDLIVVLKEYSANNSCKIAELTRKVEKQYGLRMDINLLYTYDVDGLSRGKHFFHSEIINALNLRGTRVLYGTIESVVDTEFFEERESVYVYLNNTLFLLRRFYIENIYKDLNELNVKHYLQRVIRWIFSIVRASLRLYDIYVNPYEESVAQLKVLGICSDQHLLLLQDLLAVRVQFPAINTSTWKSYEPLFSQMEEFVETFVRSAIEIASPQDRLNTSVKSIDSTKTGNIC